MLDSISVIIPAYNEEKVIGGTLQKVAGYCDANFADYEIIVVDDASKDRTREIASCFP
jgi:glycosyltransferase involved in cell wall biosynthesis